MFVCVRCMREQVLWISIGGFVFFGAYEHTKKWLTESDLESDSA